MLTDKMVERCIAIIKKFDLNYGDSFDELYAFIATLTPEQQDAITLTLIRGNRGCSTCKNDHSDTEPLLARSLVCCALNGIVSHRKCCHQHMKETS